MSIQFSLVAQFPPVSLLPPAADAAGRISPYRDLYNAQKAYIIARINQGNAALVTLTPLQAQDVNGTNAKPINASFIWLNDATASSDAFIQLAAAALLQSDATLADKIVIFDVTPEVALDTVNGFHTIALQTSASNAANITEATLHVLGAFAGANPPSTYV